MSSRVKSISLGTGILSNGSVSFRRSEELYVSPSAQHPPGKVVVDCSQSSYPSEFLSQRYKLSKMSSASTDSNLTADESDIDSCAMSDDFGEASDPEVKFTNADLYGQKHPIETSELIQRKLHELDVEVAKICTSNKKYLLEAEKRCPKLLSDSFKLKFLRTDVFEADKAATRLVKYWKNRVETFGEERAYKEITADSLTESEKKQLQLSVFNIVERKHGRNYIYINLAAIDWNIYDRDSMTRAIHYLMLRLLDDDEVSRKGGICLSCPRNTKSKQFDSKLIKYLLANIQGVFPIRLSGYHVIHPSFLFKSMFKVFGPLLPKRLRARVLLQSGSDEKVLDDMKASHGFQRDDLPIQIGGNYKCDGAAWLERQIAADL